MKEQNLNIKLIQKSWYMEGYHDREFNKEPKWIIKTGEGGPRYEENPKYGQSIEEKPAEWSEEDEEMLEYIIGDVNDATQLYTTRAGKDMANKEIAWLKSLRPSWKPSEEQMKALQYAIVIMEIREASDYDITPLKELYEQIKGLK